MLDHCDDTLTILSPAEAAELLYVGKNTIYKLITDGEIKCFKVGRIWKIPKESLVEYIKSKSGLVR